MPRVRKPHHSVYVVLLSNDVLYETRFRRCNPDYDPAKPCVYVGMTGLDPDDRFDKHKAGIRSNRFVKLYGLRLLPALYERYNPMAYGVAQAMEVELAIGLRSGLWGVAGVKPRHSPHGQVKKLARVLYDVPVE